MLWGLTITVGDWLQRTIGRYIFRRIRLRITYKKKLKDIVEGFEDCADYHKSCSLISMIGEAQRQIPSDKISIQLEKAKMLGEWFTFFKNEIDFTYLKYTSELLREFSFILIASHAIFKDFLSILKEYENLLQQLKRDENRYPTFKRLYTTTITDLEKLYKEFKEIEPRSFSSLPEI